MDTNDILRSLPLLLPPFRAAGPLYCNNADDVVSIPDMDRLDLHINVHVFYWGF